MEPLKGPGDERNGTGIALCIETSGTPEVPFDLLSALLLDPTNMLFLVPGRLMSGMFIGLKLITAGEALFTG